MSVNAVAAHRSLHPNGTRKMRVGDDRKAEAHRCHHCDLDLGGRCGHLVVVGIQRRDGIVPWIMLNGQAEGQRTGPESNGQNRGRIADRTCVFVPTSNTHDRERARCLGEPTPGRRLVDFSTVTINFSVVCPSSTLRGSGRRGGRDRPRTVIPLPTSFRGGGCFQPRAADARGWGKSPPSGHRARIWRIGRSIAQAIVPLWPMSHNRPCRAVGPPIRLPSSGN